MKKNIIWLLILSFLISCNSPAPLEYFSRCVLSTSYIEHFGAGEIRNILSLPPMVFNEKTKNLDSATYQKVIAEKIAVNKASLDKIKALKETTDAKDMMETSVGVYNLVIQDQETKYMQLAKWKDEHQMNDSLLFIKAIQLLDKDEKKVQNQLDLLWGYGKMYADHHQLDLSNTKK
jgi:hypothetical protein